MKPIDTVKSTIRTRLKVNPFVEIATIYAIEMSQQEWYDFAKELDARFLFDPMARSIVLIKLEQLP